MVEIVVDRITKRFGAFTAIEDLEIRFGDGEVACLLGPSGCGKTTLMRMIAGLERPTSGRVLFGERDVTALSTSRRNVGMVFQYPVMYPTLSVEENIALPLRRDRGIPAAERERRVAEMLDVLDMRALRRSFIDELDAGNRQKVAVGRAIARGSAIVLFDEPTTNVEVNAKLHLIRAIKAVIGRTRQTIVYVPHDQIEAMTLATKIAVLKDGILQQFGTPEEIYNNPVNMFVADFMGSPAMNLVPATIGETGNQLSVELARNGSAPVSLALNGAPQGLSAYRGKQVMFGIRPEALTDPDGADRNATHLVTADCHIEVVEPAGSDTFAVTNLGGKGVVARLRADARIKPGTTAPLTFNLTKAVFFDPATQERIA
jgi:multiple sugar transport system ATP-binding protein